MRALDSLNTDYGARTVRVGQHRRESARLGHAPGIPQPALYDELAGIAGRAVATPVTSNQAFRGCQEGPL